MKTYIFPNLDKINCLEYTIRACEILNKKGGIVTISDEYRNEFSQLDYMIFGDENKLVEECDFIIVVGGDGTILRCANIASVYNKAVLGINCGRLGFMAALEHSELELLGNMFEKKYTNSHRMMIKADITDENGIVASYNALNDVVISKCEGCKIADFEVLKDSIIISSLRADGLIFSTPTGATAYSMSAGGPIIEPDMDCIEFTQICPHSLFARSMLFSDKSTLSVKFHANKGSTAVITVDGNVVHRLSMNEQVTITKSEQSLNLIDISGGSFFKSINHKLMQPLKDSDGVNSYEK